jgi:hypothetical protein
VPKAGREHLYTLWLTPNPDGCILALPVYAIRGELPTALVLAGRRARLLSEDPVELRGTGLKGRQSKAQG